MNETKEQFIARMSAQYDKLEAGINLGNHIAEQLAAMRAQGYNVIVLGDKVKVTLKKET